MIRLDLRDLPAPEPMQRILDEVQRLPRDQRIVALTPHRPGPLLEILDAWGYAWRVQDLPLGQACVSICHTDMAERLIPPANA